MPNGQPYGLMLLKVIIRESDVDTQATADFIRQELAAMDEYIGTVDSNIKKFNTHVKSLTSDLKCRRIKGFGGSRTYNVMMGTIKWKVKDD